ncbi:MAG: P-loop NTPase [Bacillota bacterium]|nr:P-loop NTPase [Bacillota bacterium]
MVVLVMGSKGGVGKTMVAGNLASRLASLGIQVAAVDLDFESGDLSLRLGMTPALDLVQACAHKGQPGRAEWVALSPELPLSLWAAPARPELASLADETLVRSIVQSARGSAKCVVVDTPSDADSDLLYTALEDSSRVVLVSTLCPGAVRQARVTVELLKRLNYPVRERLCLVLNRVGRRGPLSIRDSSDLLGMEPCAVLPDIGHRADLEAFRGRPTVLATPRSPLARALEGLVTHVWPDAIQPGRRRFSLPWKPETRRGRGQALPWAGERYRG